MNKQALVSGFTPVGGVDPDQKYIDVRMPRNQEKDTDCIWKRR